MGDVTRRMGDVSRRDFLKRGGVGAASVLTLGSMSSVIAACGGSSNSSSGSGASGNVTPPKIGVSSAPLASYIPITAGPVLYGAPYGLHMDKSAVVTFDSNVTASQSALSGKLNVLGQSLMGHLLLVDKGLPFKIFAPYILVDDYVLAARADKVSSLADMKSPGVVVGLDEPGGAGRTAVDAILVAENAGFLTSDLTKTVTIGSSGERQSALASGQCDVTVIHLSQAQQIPKSKGPIKNIAHLYGQVPNYLKEAYAAPTDWLDKNLATASALTASVIDSSRQLSASFPKFKSAVDKLVDGPPPASELKSLLKLINQYKFWPTDGGLSDQRVQFMIDLGKKEGLIKTDLTVDKVIDRRPVQRALKMVKS